MNILRFAQVLFQPFVNVPVSEVEILNPTYYLEEIPVSINLTELSAVAILAVLLATLASYFPARKAGKIRPLEILRKH
jgi:lipoprotein-releasing system permease protein